MKKFFAFFLSIIILLFGVIFAFRRVAKDTIYDFIKGEIEKQATATLNREVKIKKIGGNLISHVTIFDLKVAKDKDLANGTIIYVRKAKVRYNLLKAIAKKDFLPAISFIELNGPDVLVVHEKDGKWNFEKILPTAESTQAPPPIFRAKIKIVDGRVLFVDEKGFLANIEKPFYLAARQINGIADFTKKDNLKFKLSGNTQEGPLNVEGNIDLVSAKTKLSLNAKNLNLNIWNKYLKIPLVEKIPLVGTVDLNFDFVNYPKLKFNCQLDLRNSKIYNLPSQGKIDIKIDDSFLSVKTTNFNFCSGNISGLISLAPLNKNQKLSARLSISEIDSTLLSFKTPGIEGRISGDIFLDGTTNDFNVKGNFSLSNAYLFGQKIDTLTANISFRDGDININEINASALQRQLVIKGIIAKDFTFNFETIINSFRFQNKNLYGGIFGLIEKFNGKISGKLNQQMFSSPFTNIDAEGELLLSGVEIGSQKISRAQGKISLKDGLFESEGFSIIFETGGVLISGSVGFKKESNLRIISKNLDISNLKFLSDLLPDNAKDISGTCDFTASVSGFLIESDNIMEVFKNLNVSLELILNNADVGIKDIKSAKLILNWENQSLSIDEWFIQTQLSKISATGKIYATNKVEIKSSGHISLNDLLPFTQRYAKIFGEINFNGEISGNIFSPEAKISLIANDVVYNNVRFDRIFGEIGYKDGYLQLYDPVVITIKNDEYKSFGKFKVFGSYPDYSGKIYTDKGNLDSIFGILKTFYIETLKEKERIESNTNVTLLTIPNLYNFRSQNGYYIMFSNRNGFLSKWQQILPQKNNGNGDTSKISKLISTISTSARTSLNIDFSIYKSNFNVSGTILANKGYISSFNFDLLQLEFVLNNDTLKIKNFTTQKGDGFLSLLGTFASNKFDIKVNSKSFDIKGIDKSFGFDEVFLGRLDLNANIYGSYNNPTVISTFKMKSGSIGEIAFDNVDAEIKLENKEFYLKKLKMEKGKQSASISGKIPFVMDKQIQLSINLDGNNIGLFASLIRGVNWNSGSGKAYLDIKGTLLKPKLNGFIKIENASLYIDQLKSSLFNLNLDTVIKDSVIQIKSLSAVLNGDRTKNKPLPFSIVGDADFSEVISKKIIILNFAISNSFGSVDIPNIYSGDFSISDTRIYGPLNLWNKEENTSNVIVKSKIILKNGFVFLPKGNGEIKNEPNIEFDVSIKVDKNVRLVQGALDKAISIDLTSMDLEIYSENLEISGTMTNPKIFGNVEVKNGSLNILGRDFTVLSEYEQEQYFGTNVSMITKNEAVFSGGEKPFSIMPYIKLTAKSEITSYTKDDNLSSTSTTMPQKETVIIITRVLGVPYVQDRSKMLTLYFYAYKLDSQKTPAEIIPVSYDENQIRVMLLPDFVKTTLGLSQGDNQQGIDTNAIIVDYLNSRLQSYLLRGVTSNIEKALGLESFTLNYNFGRDLEKILPTRRSEYQTDQTPQLGIGFVKGIFENVFLQVRYSQTLDQVGLDNNKSLNYQITWKATPWYSLIYYREPMTFQQLDSTYYKIMLQSQFVF